MRERGEAEYAAMKGFAKKGGRGKGAGAFKVSNATAVRRGNGEGSQIINHQAVGDVPSKENGRLDEAKGCFVINNDRES